MMMLTMMVMMMRIMMMTMMVHCNKFIAAHHPHHHTHTLNPARLPSWRLHAQLRRMLLVAWRGCIGG
jgi:hypothetical protein